MGRKPTRNLNLPAGMRARHRSNRVHYYLDTGGSPRKEIPLGNDYVQAVQEWSKLTSAKHSTNGVITFGYAVQKYRTEVIPTKEPRTRKDNEKELIKLMEFFDSGATPMDDIEPVHISQYKTWRVEESKARAAEKNRARAINGKPTLPIAANLGHVRANREKALFSHIWNFAREQGYTAKENPCAGVSSFKENGREVYVDDALLARLMEHAAQPLKFALRLAHLTGQRPADVYKMSETDLRDGVLFVRQCKGKAKVRIRIEGDLKTLIDELAVYKTQFKVRPLSLIVTESGQPMNAHTMRTRLDSAREAAGIPKAELQFRDMRPKAATEIDGRSGTKEAQGLLGHTTEQMTAHYIRHKAGKLVKPTK